LDEPGAGQEGGLFCCCLYSYVLYYSYY